MFIFLIVSNPQILPWKKNCTFLSDLESLGILELEEGRFENFHDTVHLNQERIYETKLPFKQPLQLIHNPSVKTDS